MKRFIYTIIVFIIPLLLLFGVLEYGLRNIPNDYAYKRQWLDKNISSVQILTIGSSLGYYGIRSQYLPGNAFNAAHVSQSIKYDEFIFNNYIESADSLRLIIWPISYFNLPYDLEEDDNAWWRVKSYCIYYDCPYHPYEIKYNSEVMAGEKVFQEISRVYKHLFTDYTECYCDSLGFGINYEKSKRIDNWYDTGLESAVRHTWNLEEKKDIIASNKQRVNAVLQKSSEKGIRVLILTPPSCQSYYDNLDQKQLRLVTDFLDSVALAYDNTEYFNLLTDSRFNEDDFYDAVHLATEGATKLTEIISEYFKNRKISDNSN